MTLLETLYPKETLYPNNTSDTGRLPTERKIICCLKYVSLRLSNKFIHFKLMDYQYLLMNVQSRQKPLDFVKYIFWLQVHTDKQTNQFCNMPNLKSSRMHVLGQPVCLFAHWKFKWAYCEIDKPVYKSTRCRTCLPIDNRTWNIVYTSCALIKPLTLAITASGVFSSPLHLSDPLTLYIMS